MTHETDDVRSTAVKLRALHEATGHELPTGPIEQMLEDIERRSDPMSDRPEGDASHLAG